MKLLLLFIPAMIFLACEMPGVGEIAQELEDKVDGVSSDISSLTGTTDDLQDRIDDIERQLSSLPGAAEFPDMPQFDPTELMESMDSRLEEIEARADSAMLVLAAGNDSLTAEIEELTEKVTSLEGQLASLRNTVNSMGSNSGDSGRVGSGSTGGRGDSGDTGGRGGSTGGTSGGR